MRRDATETDRKRIMPLTWGVLQGRAGWHLRHAASPRSLYGLDRIARCSTVVVCEGEKAADAAQAMFPKMACTTWTAGTGNVSRADWSALAGKKVIIWPDNDEPGEKAAAEIRDILSGIAASVRMVNVSDLDPGADAADLRVEDVREWFRSHVGPILCGASVKRPPESAPIQQLGRRAAGLEPIQVRAGEIDLVATAGERALMAANAPVYQRGTSLTRPGKREVAAADGRTTYAACLIDITAASMTDLLCQVVEWNKYDKRANGWKQIDPPPAVAQIILSRSGSWPFPAISGVITTPTLRPDGSVLMAPGYDPVTRLYHVDDPLLEMTLPDPTRREAERSLNSLNVLLQDFPFETDVDRSVALAGLITPVVRGMMPVCPMFAFRATAPGSGKSYLVDLAASIATGRQCPVTNAGHDQEEMDKRLGGLLLSGYPIMSLDNVNGELGGDLLCQAVERPIVRLRELGKSNSIEIDNKAVIFATGNALRVKGDMTRRTVMASLDPKMEQPELRQFRTNPVQVVAADRGKYVAACLTIVRAYLASGHDAGLAPMASFEVWSRTVRSALVWLGEEDPCLSMVEAREDDPEFMERSEVIGLLAEAIGIGEHCARTANEIDELSQADDTDLAGYKVGLKYRDLRTALLKIAGTPAGKINPRRLGWWFLNNRGRLTDGLKIVDVGTKHKTKKWAVLKE